jgi:tetratricopeptide (TPR) repeat protein
MLSTATHLVLATLPGFVSIPLQSKPAESRPGKDEAKENIEYKDGIVSIAIPDQPLVASVAVDEFKREKNSASSGRTLVLASIAKEGTLTVTFDQNFPHQSSSNLREQWSKRPNYQVFNVGNIACCEFTNEARGAFVQSFYHAHPVLPDYSFDISVTVARIDLKGSAPTPKFTRDDFVKIVKSFAVTGETSREKFRLPPEVYAIRDRAIKTEHDQLNWASKQCSASPEDFAVHYYFGALATRKKQFAFASDGYTRAVELLLRRESRTAKEESALLDALVGASSSFMIQKRYREASSIFQKTLDLTKPDGGDLVKKAREDAIYLLACCYAQIAQPEKALETLKNALAATPSLRSRAKEDPLLAPIRNNKELAKLIEG